MKKVVALMLGLALLAVVLTPQADAAHGRGTAFFVGALTGALVAGAVAALTPILLIIIPIPSL